MKNYVLLTSGALANKVEIREDDKNSKLIYSSSKNVIERIINLLATSMALPVSFTLKGHDGISDLQIKSVSKRKYLLIEDNIQLGCLIGRKLTNLDFSICVDKEDYFFKGDSSATITKVSVDNVDIGCLKFDNQTFPHLDWKSEIFYDMDKRIAATALLYNYMIRQRV